jgi:hypothetical protein
MDMPMNDIKKIEEKILNLVPAGFLEWDPILALIHTAEETEAYRSLGHPNLSDWLRKIRTLSHPRGGSFRYEIRSTQGRRQELR